MEYSYEEGEIPPDCVPDFSPFVFEPPENDLLEHMPLISEDAKKDKDLSNSKHLLTFVEKPSTNKACLEDVRTMKKSEFIVDSYDDDEMVNDEVFCEEDNELYDYVCAICDNGGEILSCEGVCMRSFHANKDAGADSLCETLGYTDAQVEAMPIFLCRNCKFKQHQCFACGVLGSSDRSSGAEVFPCVSATCSHFYHPECVVKMLHPVNETQEELQEKIAAGEAFTCPVHKCVVCKQGENKKVHDLQFAMCRRCPKAYHRKCLPRRISFECNYEEDIAPRAWDDLLPNRILIYCMDHEIIRELGTPVRDHLRFPNVEGKRKQHTIEQLSSKEKVGVSRIKIVYENFTAERTVLKSPKQVKKIENRCFIQAVDSLKKPNTADTVRKSSKDNFTSIPYKSFAAVESKSALKNNTSSVDLETYLSISKRQKLPSGKIKSAVSKETVMKKTKSSQFVASTEMENEILALMKNVTSSFNEKERIKRQKVQATDAYCSENVLGKTITLGKVEGSVKAIQTALRKLDEGCSIEDAKAVCEPEILCQIFKWQRKLKVYMAPFLHGMRYTSFGRHFTKVDKLKEIVNRLHCYVQNGDTIVDFCCGSNDFSCLMKEKLEKMGKLCSFKNYDLIQAKNDFSFEKRDWTSVKPEELPDGSQLIMGLNPPFGVKASLANKFINKALQFRPKLLILIVPKETTRLDQKKQAYNLIWEDDEVLSGKSFYLPGSVDVHDKQLEDWNLKPPPLYLWSRPDWTAKHKAIAQEHCHISNEQAEMHVRENINNNYLMEKNPDCYWDYSGLHPSGPSGDINSIFNGVLQESYGNVLEGTQATFPDKLKENQKQFQEYMNGTQYVGVSEAEIQGKYDGGIPSGTNDMHNEVALSYPGNSPINYTGLESLFGEKITDVLETLEMEAAETGRQDLPSAPGCDLLDELEHGEIQTGSLADVESMHGSSSRTNVGHSWFENVDEFNQS